MAEGIDLGIFFSKGWQLTEFSWRVFTVNGISWRDFRLTEFFWRDFYVGGGFLEGYFTFDDSFLERWQAGKWIEALVDIYDLYDKENLCLNAYPMDIFCSTSVIILFLFTVYFGYLSSSAGSYAWYRDYIWVFLRMPHFYLIGAGVRTIHLVFMCFFLWRMNLLPVSFSFIWGHEHFDRHPLRLLVFSWLCWLYQFTTHYVSRCWCWGSPDFHWRIKLCGLHFLCLVARDLCVLG